MDSILVLPLYGAGDVLMTTPALRNLKENRDIKITYLHMFETTRDILQNNPYIDENIYFPFLQKSKMANVRFLLQFRNKYRYSINFYPSNRRDYNLASFIVGSSCRIGHRYLRRDLLELNFLKNRTEIEDDSLHNVQENLRLLSFLGIEKAVPYPLEIYLSNEEKSFSLQWLNAHNIDEKLLIGIHAGTSTFKNHYMKRWPEDSFAEVIDRLSAELGSCAFLLFGGPEEKPLREKVRLLTRHSQKVFSVDSASIRQAAALMKRCHFFLSNDSGPMHMAAASGIPTIAIFGPTNPAWVGPWGVRRKIIRVGLDCSPCFRYSPKPMKCFAKLNNACIRQISVEQVFAAIIELINEKI